jgi:hypothetical protein
MTNMASEGPVSSHVDRKLLASKRWGEWRRERNRERNGKSSDQRERRNRNGKRLQLALATGLIPGGKNNGAVTWFCFGGDVTSHDVANGLIVMRG